jgi:hypothetical protein
MEKTIRKLHSDELARFTHTNTTQHIATHRRERLEAYSTGEYLEGFEVDKAHPNGTEAHIIDVNGFIHIYNMRTAKFITVKSARPAQIKRHYIALDIPLDVRIEKSIKTAHARNEEEDANNI